jgi:YVTN family beta-propeller protein
MTDVAPDSEPPRLDQEARLARRAAARRARVRRRRQALGVLSMLVAVGVVVAVLSSSGGTRPRAVRAKVASRFSVPPLLDPANVYAADYAGNLSPVVRGDPALVYVPNSLSSSVYVIDQRTYKIIRRFRVGRRPQHVVPSYDLKTLYAVSDLGNSLRPIDPATGRPSDRAISVPDPYNLYFTPDGRYAITVAELLKRLDFRDPHTMALRVSLPVPTCPGVDHADFSADGSYMYVSCEYLGAMIEVDLQRLRVIRTLDLHPKPASAYPVGSVRGAR